jgi:hypothetical protein
LEVNMIENIVDANDLARVSTTAGQTMRKVKVLFLAANPVGTQLLQLDEEICQISAKLRAAECGDSLELISRWAVRPDDLLQALLEEKPHIVHFSGHGSSAGELIVLDDRGNPKRVSKEAIVSLFRTLTDNIRVVVLNACHTRSQAAAIAKSIDCTVGMNRPVGDEAAIVFAASFYRALGFGRSVKEAFELGKAALLLEGISEDQTPELLARKGVDASRLVLAAAPVTAMLGAEKLAVKGLPKRLGVLERVALVRDLSGLAPVDWATLVAAIEGAGPQVSSRVPVAEQVAELVRWAEGTTGPGLVTVGEAAKELSLRP